MTLYSLALFVHVTAVLSLFAALSFEVLSLFHLRGALLERDSPLDWTGSRSALGCRGLTACSLLSGAYLAMRMSALDLAWPKVAVGALLLITLFGALTGRRMPAIRRACADAKAINSQLFSRL